MVSLDAGTKRGWDVGEIAGAAPTRSTINMIYAFLEDGTLSLYATEDDAVRDFEGVDVAAGVVEFFDAAGRRLEPQFSAPNRRGKLFGLIPWSESGVYRLTKDSSQRDAAFSDALREAVALDPNPWYRSLEELRAALAARGFDLDSKNEP